MPKVSPPPRGNPIQEYLRRRQVLALVQERLAALMAANEQMRGRGRDPFGGPGVAVGPRVAPNPFGGPRFPVGPGVSQNPFEGPSRPSGPGPFNPGPSAPVLPPFDVGPSQPSLPPIDPRWFGDQGRVPWE
jgi:hypothetical protein